MDLAVGKLALDYPKLDLNFDYSGILSYIFIQERISPR
jgi:hypothetical protein